MKNYLPNIKAITGFIHSKLSDVYKLLGIEGIIWIVALIYLTSLTITNQQHFTIYNLSAFKFRI
ncbi:MAG: hypothetical protein ACUVRG_01630 [Ignavibacterium sp.]|uniref:hypothetical protein n=1 Tax=Ignavibacterium sp. TaxID=2651167 RepID=UPI004049337F